MPGGRGWGWYIRVKGNIDIVSSYYSFVSGSLYVPLSSDEV